MQGLKKKHSLKHAISSDALVTPLLLEVNPDHITAAAWKSSLMCSWWKHPSSDSVFKLHPKAVMDESAMGVRGVCAIMCRFEQVRSISVAASSQRIFKHLFLFPWHPQRQRCVLVLRLAVPIADLLESSSCVKVKTCRTVPCFNLISHGGGGQKNVLC